MSATNKYKDEFSQLIEKNQGIIHKVTLIYANTLVDRQDLFQEICLQLWRSYANFRNEASFSTWMYRVAINTAINSIRKKKNGLSFEPLNDHQLFTVPIDANDHSQLLYRSISKLSRIDKAIILMWLEERNYEEIASIIGITKSNVSVKLVRIKKRLEAEVLKLKEIEL